MAQSFGDVQRHDMFVDGSLDLTAAHAGAQHMDAEEGQRVDALLAEADAAQHELVNLLGKTTVADTAPQKPRTTFNWGNVTLASDGHDMPCYDHKIGTWL